jgi:chromosome segregation ATPase
MFRYLRALWYCITGRFAEARKALQENKYVMTATYDRAIDKSKDRFETVKNAVAELINIEQTRVGEIKDIGSNLERLTKVKTGAQMAMQKRIDELKGQGKSKEEILADPTFIKHKGAYEDASSTLAESQKRYDEKEADLKERRKQIAVYKTELQGMQRSTQALEQEKNEAVADVAIAQQQEAINSTLAGLATDTTDKDLADAREARKRSQARAKITSELAGNDAKHAENEYLAFADQKAANTELDKLLNWGDEKPKEELAPAKLPE